MRQAGFVEPAYQFLLASLILAFCPLNGLDLDLGLRLIFNGLGLQFAPASGPGFLRRIHLHTTGSILFAES